MNLERQLESLSSELSEKPKNIYDLVKQREKVDSLPFIIASFNQEYQVYLYDLCE